MITEAVPTNASAQRGLGGKYLTFVLGHESYGIEVLRVREIIRLVDFTAVPQMPTYVKGVINLRGKIIPIVDLRLKFALASADTTARTCIVVVQVALPSGVKTQMGVIVDGVEEVINITHADVEDAPDFGAMLDTNYILGMAKIRGSVKTLLDIDRVISADTIQSVQQAVTRN